MSFFNIWFFFCIVSDLIFSWILEEHKDWFLGQINEESLKIFLALLDDTNFFSWFFISINFIFPLIFLVHCFQYNFFLIETKKAKEFFRTVLILLLYCFSFFFMVSCSDLQECRKKTLKLIWVMIYVPLKWKYHDYFK